MIGQVVNYRYEILEKCGDGSFFTVYKARDKVLNRLVAVKILLPQFAANRDFAERVVAEAQAVSELAHPNIVKVHEADQHDGSYFIAMEYVRGIKLKDKIRRLAPFPAAQALDLTIAIAEALDYAHQHSIAHGDVRPQNVIVTSDSQVKVTDFGMAGAIGSFPRIQTSASLRSIHYTAPEVSEGHIARPSSDIYSLGIVLYEMLTGTVPFDGDTPIAVALRHAKDPPPSPRALNPAAPRSVEAIVLKMLQKLPEERYRSIPELLADLRQVRTQEEAAPSGRTIEEPPPPREIVSPKVEEETTPGFLGGLLRGAFVLFVVMVVAFAALFGYIVFSNPGETVTPSIVGKSRAEAEVLARQAGLDPVVAEETYDDRYPAGQVYMTDPEAGMRVKRGQPLRLWVSRGPRYTRVPDVTDLPEDKARSQILDAGLTVGEILQEYDDKVPAGSVFKQRPSPGTQVDRGKSVTLFVSLGKTPVEAPVVTSDEGQDGNGAERSFSVALTVPTDGPESRTVRIVVTDDYGERTAYEEERRAADRVREVVTGVGKPITISVYVDDKLIDEQVR